MPNTTDLRTPPELRGTAEEKLQQLWSWAYQTIELLQIAINRESTTESVADNTDTVNTLSGAVSVINMNLERASNTVTELNHVVQSMCRGNNGSLVGSFVIGYSVLK